MDDTGIPAAIAQWDVQAQRALAREPTTHAMTRVAGPAFAATVHAARLWRAAVETGHVDRRAFEHEIAPALETMIETWDHTHTLLRQLSHRLDTSPPALSRAGWELPTAMREVTGGTAGPATFADIDRRVEMSSLVRSLHRFHATVAGVAGVFRETARSAPLLVDAQTANILLKSADDLRATLSAGDGTRDPASIMSPQPARPGAGTEGPPTRDTRPSTLQDVQRRGAT